MYDNIWMWLLVDRYCLFIFLFDLGWLVFLPVRFVLLRICLIFQSRVNRVMLRRAVSMFNCLSYLRIHHGLLSWHAVGFTKMFGRRRCFRMNGLRSQFSSSNELKYWIYVGRVWIQPLWNLWDGHSIDLLKSTWGVFGRLHFIFHSWWWLRLTNFNIILRCRVDRIQSPNILVLCCLYVNFGQLATSWKFVILSNRKVLSRHGTSFSILKLQQ